MPLEIAELRLRGFTSSHLHIFMWELINNSGNGGIDVGNYIFPFDICYLTIRCRKVVNLDADDSVDGLLSLADPS